MKLLATRRGLVSSLQMQMHTGIKQLFHFREAGFGDASDFSSAALFYSLFHIILQ